MNMIPRAEHPRPDRQRGEWLSLNGEWDFEIDNAKVGKYKNFQNRESLDGKIIVPFCPESKLSGVAHTDFINAVWYTRKIDVPENWAGKRVILHLDACNHTTTVFVNGKRVGEHFGGYTSFAFDITSYLGEENRITVYAESDLQSGKQLSGKQSRVLESRGCYYTRTTGIWQTVWLEAVNEAYVRSYKACPNIDTASVNLEVIMSEVSLGGKLTVEAYYEGKLVGTGACEVSSTSTWLGIALSERHLWEVGCGRLYDLVFKLEKDGKTDEMTGYFGLREVSLSKKGGLQINGKTVFGRFVLDQGFYPDGIITAPSDEALIFDIEASMACGFNGARLHQKVFEPRFLYHADKRGYMVWAETGNWGFDHTIDSNIYYMLPEWIEEVERDFSHPAVIGWCPFNETWDRDGRRQSIPLIDTVYDVTKTIDKTRPVIAVSGSWPTTRTDAHDVHDYEQDPEKLYNYYCDIDKGIVRDGLFRRDPHRQVSKTHLPIFVSEYGGIKWIEGTAHSAVSWGYGKDVTSEEEFLERLEGLTNVLLDNPHIFAYCYTQLTDVEQEQNGLLTYDRRFKFAPEKYHKILSRKSVIED